jgi:autotransporter-associated beta strand protein
MHFVKRRAVLGAAVAATISGWVSAPGIAQTGGSDRRGPTLRHTPGWNATTFNTPSREIQNNPLYPGLLHSKTGLRAQTAGWRGDFLTSWSVPTNWSTSVVPNAVDDTAAFDITSEGRFPLLDINVNLSSINVTDPQATSLITSVDENDVNRNTVITLNGPATLHVNSGIPDVRDFVFGDTGFVFPGFQVDAVIAGSAGLNKTGPGSAYLSRDNTYSGNTVVSGGRLTIETDNSLGTGGGSLALNNSTLQVFGDFQTSRNISIGTGGARIELLGPMIPTGDISGSQPLTLLGPFITSVATFSTANSLTGAVTLNNATTTFNGLGGFANAPVINNSVLSIVHNNAAGNHLSNSANLSMAGGLLVQNTSGSAYNEQIGTMALGGGFSIIRMVQTSPATSITASALDRGPNRGGVKFQAVNLGQTPGPGNNNVFFSTAPTLIDGLIPFAWANPVNFDVPQSPNNTLVTYDAVNGVVPLAVGSYSSSFAGANATTNVRITVDTLNVPGGGVTVNSLVLAPDTSDPDGIDINGGPITVDTGIVLNAHAGGSSSAGINFIFNNMNFGTREAIFITPSALRSLGVISGTGGLTKLGGEAMLFQGVNTYTGTTNLTGFNVIFDNVVSGSNGPFGPDTSPIVLNSTGLTEFNSVTGEFEGSAAAQLIMGVVGPKSFNRPLDVRGGPAFMYSFATGAWSMNGAININQGATFGLSDAGGALIFNGNITGPGGIQIGGNFQPPDGPVVTLSGNNSFGSLDLVDGTVNLGSDTAMGSGLVTVKGSTSIVPFGGPRTFPNNIAVHSDSTLTIGGSSAATFSGTMDLVNLVFVDGTNFFVGFTVPIDVTATATTTFSGKLTRGGLSKGGPGLLVLSGNNDFAGPLIVGNGTTTGGTVILRHNNAAGLPLGPTEVNVNSTLGLENNITIPDGELLQFAGSGDGGVGALRNISGNNTWGGSAVGFGSIANVVRADSGTLTIKGALVTQDLENDPPTLFNLPLTKTGSGVVNVGSDTINEGDPDQFQGAIVLNTGPLTISQGTLRVTPTTPANAVLSSAGNISIAGGPATPTAKLDLNNTSMVVEYGANPTPLQAIRQLIRAGFNNGAWTGNGITSSTAATSPNAGETGKTALGYAEMALIPAGQPGDTAVLIKYTYFGDSNLDGQVDVADLGALATAWQTVGTWINGDFDYNNTIDVNDLGLLATNWQDGVGNPLGPSLAEALAELGLPQVSVPEPGSLAVFASAALTLCRRRRTRD